MSHRYRSEDTTNASPTPIQRRRRVSIDSYDSDSDDHYRPRGSHQPLSNRQHKGHHHRHEYTRARDVDRKDRLPRQIRQSLAPEDRDSSSGSGQECGCDHHCRDCHQRAHHELRDCQRQHLRSPSNPHHCHDCLPERSQHDLPRRHASLHLPARQVTFQDLPPHHESHIGTGMTSMKIPPPGVRPPSAYSSFAGPFPSQLHQAGHPTMVPAADYTTMSNVLGMNVQTMPFASPHIGSGMGPLGAGYPNAMPLSRSVEILPAPGQYGAPKYMKFTKRDYRRDCYSVGNADVPYAAAQMQPGMSVVPSAAMTLPPMMGMSMLPMA